MNKKIMALVLVSTALLTACSSNTKSTTTGATTGSAAKTTEATTTVETTTETTLYKPVSSEITISKAEYLTDYPITKREDRSGETIKYSDLNYRVYVKTIPGSAPEKEIPYDESSISSEEYCQRYGKIWLSEGTRFIDITITVEDGTKEEVIEKIKDLEKRCNEDEKPTMKAESFDTENKTGIHVFGTVVSDISDDGKEQINWISIYACLDDKRVICYTYSVIPGGSQKIDYKELIEQVDFVLADSNAKVNIVD